MVNCLLSYLFCNINATLFLFVDFTELNYESDEEKDFDTDGEYEILSL